MLILDLFFRRPDNGSVELKHVALNAPFGAPKCAINVDIGSVL
jgi:hypothetical protein